jgi:hypothetical protein
MVALFGISSLALAQSPVPSNAPTGFPAWWFEWNVISPTNHTNTSPTWPGDYPASDDYSAINQGTLKNLALGAITELQAQLPAAVLTNSNAVALQNLIAGWTTNPATNADNYAAVNQGQLKYIAKQFYDLLGSGSYTAGLGLQPTNWTGTYPWPASATNADPYALANIGQAKYVFSFDLTAPAGQVPAWWAQYYFGTTNVSPNSLSPSGDGNTLLQDYLLGNNPKDFYNGTLPSLSIVSGASQTGSAGQLLSAPLVVSVTDASNNPILNAPVTFAVGSSGGSLVASSVGTAASSLTIQTDGNGLAQVFYQLPSGNNATSTVTCSTSSGTNSESVSFSESSDDGTGAYANPFNPSSVVANANDDGSIDVSWVNNADPSDTRPITIKYMDVNGNWQTLVPSVPAGTTHYHVPAH